MQVDVHVSLASPSAPLGGKSVMPAERGLQYTAPPQLVDAGFPASEALFAVPSVAAATAASTKYADPIAAGLTTGRKNHVVYAYGQRYGPKRQQLFGANGLAAAVMSKVAAAPAAGSLYQVVCYGVGVGEALVDFIDSNNQDGVVLETAHESPKPTKLEAVTLASPADAQRVAGTINQNVEAYFKAVANPPSTPEEQAMPPYIGTTVVFALYRYEEDNRFGTGYESNSAQLIALGDSDRPVLLGVDPTQQHAYEETQRHLGAVCGIVTAINCNRLRIPYGKTKFTSMLKRAYNAEKGSAQTQVSNEPTHTVFWAHVLDDHGSSEEAYHALCTVRKCVSLVGGISVGNVTRDLAAEKWRVEQDIVELKDELAIARAVHEYKPCIHDQPKPVTNIGEEVRKRVEAVKKKRAEQRAQAEREVEKRAAEEAEKYIAKLEKDTGLTLAGLEKKLKDLQDEKTKLELERNKRREEHERHLAKIHKKRDEEEKLADRLRAEVEALESELTAKKDLVAKKRSQLDAASEDQAKGRAAILKERDEIRATRERLYQQRRDERSRWLAEIEAANKRLQEQVAALTAARKEAEAQGVKAAPDEEDTEEAIVADIESIKEYLPKLISLEDVPADPEAVDAIRRQLEEYFEGEKTDYAEKLEREKARLQQLQSEVDNYKSKLEEHQAKQKREMLAEAMKKDNHLQSLVDQVIQYLQHGLRMYKVSSQGNVRYRFFYLTEDCKKLCACELDENGMAINRRKPTATIVLKDVTRVTLGTYSASFIGFAGEARLGPMREGAMRDDGSSSAELTQPIKPENLGKYNYRSFGLDLNSGKTLELVCETDSDWEAWIVAWKRLFNFRTEYERRTQRSAREESATVRWGKAMSMSRFGQQTSGMHVDEITFCSEHHIPPQLFGKAKAAVVGKSQTAFVTIYDVRVACKLDLLRSQQLYEFFIDHRVIPPPRK